MADLTKREKQLLRKALFNIEILQARSLTFDAHRAAAYHAAEQHDRRYLAVFEKYDKLAGLEPFDG